MNRPKSKCRDGDFVRFNAVTLDHDPDPDQDRDVIHWPPKRERFKMYRFAVTLLDPFLLCYLATILALVAMWLRRDGPIRGLRLLTTAFVALSITCTPAVSYVALGTLEWRYPPQFDRPADVSAIVALGGYVQAPSSWHSRPTLGTDSFRRCLRTADLYHQGEPCLVIVTGGKVIPTRQGPSPAEAMDDLLGRLGLAERDLLIETRSTTTYENALETGKLLRQRGIQSVVLVTDATHLLRSEMCFRRQGIEVVPVGSYYRTADFRWHWKSFFPHPGTAEELVVVLHEWAGIAWYRLHGRV